MSEKKYLSVWFTFKDKKQDLLGEKLVGKKGLASGCA